MLPVLTRGPTVPSHIGCGPRIPVEADPIWHRMTIGIIIWETSRVFFAHEPSLFLGSLGDLWMWEKERSLVADAWLIELELNHLDFHHRGGRCYTLKSPQILLGNLWSNLWADCALESVSIKRIKASLCFPLKHQMQGAHECVTCAVPPVPFLEGPHAWFKTLLAPSL